MPTSQDLHIFDISLLISPHRIHLIVLDKKTRNFFSPKKALNCLQIDFSENIQPLGSVYILIEYRLCVQISLHHGTIIRT